MSRPISLFTCPSPVPTAPPVADATSDASPSTAPSAAQGSRISDVFVGGPHLVSNADYLPKLLAMLDSAKKSIDLVQYNFYSESGAARSVVDKLIALKAAKPELQIRLFLEGDHGDAATRNRVTAKLLTDHGIQVQLDSPDVVTHAKGVCVDGNQLLIGSTNLSTTSLTKNNETNLGLRSSEQE